jgi:hypothetical protein
MCTGSSKQGWPRIEEEDEPMDGLVLYDLLQPPFNGRFTGRRLLPLLLKLALQPS